MKNPRRNRPNKINKNREKWSGKTELYIAAARLLAAAGCILLLAAAVHLLALRPDPQFGSLTESCIQTQKQGMEGEPEPSSSGMAELFSDETEASVQEDRGDGPGRKKDKGPGENLMEPGGQEPQSIQEPPPVWKPPKAVLASDLHYFSPLLTDYGEAFWTMTNRDDGKVIPYNTYILQAFLEEVQEIKPDVLILSGDLTLYGEKINHEELAGELRKVQQSGIPVVVVPGNHDINHPWAVSYFGAQTEPVETVDQNGFYEIYHEFGYDQAVSRDEASLSYLYQLDEKNCLLMLDTCQYEPENKVGGRIREAAFPWIRRQLEYAGEQGWKVTVVGHHNLLDESRLYTYDCTIENNQKLIQLLESYGASNYFSGHLHAQRGKKHRVEPGVSEDAFGIEEEVTTSLMIPPCQYGVIRWDDQNGLHYTIRRTDVESWAAKYDYHNEDLLEFSRFSEAFMDEVISGQVLPTIKNLPEEASRDMALYYARIIRKYCAGESLAGEPVDSDRIYQSWKRNQSDNHNFKSMQSMLKD